MTYFLDANVPMYANGRESEFKVPCADLLTAVAERRIEAVTNVEVIQEVVYIYYRRGDLHLGLTIAGEFTDVLQTVLPVEAVECMTMLDLLLAHQSIEPRDALHYAVMLRHGISHIITADTHFDSLPGITRIDPRDASTIVG